MVNTVQAMVGRINRGGSPGAESKVPSMTDQTKTAALKWSGGWLKLEARAGIEPAVELLQSSALPLGDRAVY